MQGAPPPVPQRRTCCTAVRRQQARARTRLQVLLLAHMQVLLRVLVCTLVLVLVRMQVLVHTQVLLLLRVLVCTLVLMLVQAHTLVPAQACMLVRERELERVCTKPPPAMARRHQQGWLTGCTRQEQGLQEQGHDQAAAHRTFLLAARCHRRTAVHLDTAAQQPHRGSAQTVTTDRRER